MSVSCGASCCLFINDNQDVHALGSNEYDKLGILDRDTKVPIHVTSLSNIKKISCGAGFTVCIDHDGNIFCLGKTKNCKQNVEKTTRIPIKVSIPPCTDIACGDEFAICLTFENTLYSFGDKISGLGRGNTENGYPELIDSIDNVEKIAACGYFVICKCMNGEFYSWGSNDLGQLGNGTLTYSNIPKLCENWPSDIISFKCGRGHVLLLTIDGNVYGFGSNKQGQLACEKSITHEVSPKIISGLPEIQRIKCGSFHSMCIDTDGKLWVFGNSYFGQLGLGNTNNQFKPVLNKYLENIIDISEGGGHTFVKTIDNKIYVFGRNDIQQCGSLESKLQSISIPKQVFIGKEDIWGRIITRSKQKSARK